MTTLAPEFIAAEVPFCFPTPKGVALKELKFGDCQLKCSSGIQVLQSSPIKPQQSPEEKRFKHKCYLLLLVTLSPTRKTTKPPALTQHEQKEKNYYVTGLSKWRKYSAWQSVRGWKHAITLTIMVELPAYPFSCFNARNLVWLAAWHTITTFPTLQNGRTTMFPETMILKSEPSQSSSENRF